MTKFDSERLKTASEKLMANLPILILGPVIFLAVAREFIA